MTDKEIQKKLDQIALPIDQLVDKFLAWPLPESVCADLCATRYDGHHRCGTNLLTATEAKQMLEYLLGAPDRPVERKL